MGQSIPSCHLPLMKPVTLLASNTTGNLPLAVLFIKLRPGLGSGPLFGLAMLSTSGGQPFSGGLHLQHHCGRAGRLQGANLNFTDFARSGVPLTIPSMAATIGWLLATELVVL